MKQHGRNKIVPPSLGVIILPFMICVLACALMGSLEGVRAIPVYACGLFGIGLICLSLDKYDQPDRSFLFWLFSWGFVLRIVYAILLYYWLINIFGGPYLGGGDDELFESNGRKLFENWLRGDFSIPNRMAHQPGYYVVIAGTRYIGEKLGGYHSFMTRIFNAFVGGLMAPYIFILARNIFNHRIAKIASKMVMFFPLFVFYSSVQLRDIAIVFLFVLSMSQLSRFVIHGRAWGVIIAVACCLPMLYLRVVFAYLMLGCVAISLLGCLLFQRGSIRTQLWRKVIVLSVTFCLMAGFLNVVENISFVSKEDSELAQPLEEGHVAERVELQQRKKLSAYSPDNSIAKKIMVGLPPGVGFVAMPVIALIMPYPPWLMLLKDGPSIKYAYFICYVSWTILIPLCVLGLMKVVRERFPENLLVIVPMAFVLVAASVGGFHNRYKLAFFPFALVLCAIGLIMVGEKRDNMPKELYLMMQLGMLGAYYTAKMLI